MKKILSLLSLLMLFVMTASADTVVLSAPTSSAKTHSDADGIITITDATDNTGIQVGSGKLDYDGGSATPMKLSGTRQFNLSYSAAVTVTKVWLYATNAKASTASDYKAGTIGLDSKDRTSLGNLPEKGATPLKVDITGKAGLNANTQFLAVIVVEYSSTAPSLTVSPKELSFSLNPSVTTKTQSFTLTGKNLTDGTYDLAVPSVTGLTVTPTQFTVAEGAVSHEVQVTYASTEDVAKATADITATVGEQTAKVTLSYQSRAVAYTQSTVSDAAAWDWSKVTGSVELTAETTPTKEDEFLLADVDDRVEFPAAFGDAKALMMTGFQYPTHSAGYAQGKTIKFKTSVPGVLTVEFSNTGTSDRPDRYLNVNGVNTTFKSKNTDKVTATDINVPAGEVVLMGNMVDTGAGSGFTPNMLRWYKITFTPKAFDATFDFANNPQSWPVSTEIADYETGKVTDLTVSNVKLTAIRNNEYMGNILYKADGSSPAMFRVGKFNAFKLTAPEGKALVGVAVTMATDGQAFDFEASNGAIAANAWTGNATEVTFTTSNNRQIAKIEITLADENSETIKPAAAVEAATIAEFLALEDGKEVKLTLTDARVNGVNGGSYYVEDATGALVIKGVALTTGTKLNGYILGTKSVDSSVDMDNVIVEHQLTSTDATTFAATAATLEGTVMAVNAVGAQANYGKLITVENVTISGGNNKTLTDPSGNTIKARDYMGVLPMGFEWPAKASKLTGVLVYYVTGWYLMPISAEAIVPYVQPTEVTFDFTDTESDLVFGKGGTADEQNAGDLAGKGVVRDNVTMTVVNSPSITARCFYLASKGYHFQLGTKNCKLRLTAPTGYAITGIEFTQNGAATSNYLKFDVDKGEGALTDINEGKRTWTGNATSVRFNTTGATYINQIKVTLAAVNEQTVTPAADAYTTEVSTLAELNALPANTLVKLNLNNVIVTTEFANKLGYYIQDATAGTALYATGLSFNLNDVLNGYVYLNRADNEQKNPGNRVAMAEDTNADNIQVTANGSFTPVEGATVAAVSVSENICKVVQFNNVKVVGSSKTAATITDSAEGTIKISNAGNNFSTSVYTEDLSSMNIADATVVGVLVATASGNQLYPISIVDNGTVGISTVGAANENVQIYNLQGVRLNQLQRGLNIVNGKKIVVK